jgi:hypothetical protein
LARISSPDAAPSSRAILALAGKLLLLALVGGFELIVLGWAMHPRISADYRRHFIDRSSACWSPPGYQHVVARWPRPGVIIPTRLDEATSCVYFPDGWGIRDPDGLWTIGPRARMKLPVTAGRRRISLWFRAPGFLPMPQGFAIRQSGALLASGQIARKVTGRVDLLPDVAAADGDGFISLDLMIAHPARPRDWSWRHNDKRLLGLMLTRVEIPEPYGVVSSPGAH